MLTDTKVKGLRSGRLSDARGLYVVCLPSGAKSWRYDFRFPRSAKGRRQTLTLGNYPDFSLADAREAHQEARKALAKGENPCAQKQAAKREQAQRGADSFKALAESWYETLEGQRSKSWRGNVRRWLKKRIYPEIGSKPVKDVQAADVLAILRAMEREGKARSGEHVRQLVSQIFDHAVVNLRATFNPAQSLSGALTPPAHVPHPHLSEKELPDWLKRLDAYPLKQPRLAAYLLLLTATRKGELLGAKWTEIDFTAREWRIPAEKMKSGKEHIVPLSDQALECLRELQNASEYVLTSETRPHRPMSKNPLDKIFWDLGEISPHGVRSTFSTIANERSGFSGDVIEAALAHVEPDQVRRVYNRAQWLEQRAKLLQWWGDYLENARKGNVIALARRA